MRYSQAFRFVPREKDANAEYALRKVSWTRSSASAGLRVIRRAAEYNWSSIGMASRSNLAARSSAVSSVDVSCVRVAGTALPSHRPVGAVAKAVWDAFEDTRRSPGRQ
ncbi:hypothetical protein GCM10018963_34020 [Saccharothrix longispora]